MSREIEVKIGRKPYRMQTEDGQENRVSHVAEMWDKYVEKLLSAAPNMERDRVLVLAGMMLADDFLTMSQEKEMHEKSTDAFHNTMAEKIESILKEKGAF